MPRDALFAAPCAHPLIARIGPPVAGFLMGKQSCDIIRAHKRLQYGHRLSLADHQRLTKICKRGLKVGEAVCNKSPVSRCGIGQRPEVGLDNIDRQNRPLAGCSRKRLMVPNAQITFEPHKCDVALLMRERSVHIALFRTKKRGTMSPLLFFQNRSTLSQRSRQLSVFFFQRFDGFFKVILRDRFICHIRQF